MNTCNNIELHGFVLSLFTSAAGRRYLIGKQVADMLNKETFNLYQSMSRRGIDPERGTVEQLDFLKDTVAVRSGSRSVTLLPYEETVQYMEDMFFAKPSLYGESNIGSDDNAMLVGGSSYHRLSPSPTNVGQLGLDGMRNMLQATNHVQMQMQGEEHRSEKEKGASGPSSILAASSSSTSPLSSVANSTFPLLSPDGSLQMPSPSQFSSPAHYQPSGAAAMKATSNMNMNMHHSSVSSTSSSSAGVARIPLSPVRSKWRRSTPETEITPASNAPIMNYGLANTNDGHTLGNNINNSNNINNGDNGDMEDGTHSRGSYSAVSSIRSASSYDNLLELDELTCFNSRRKRKPMEWAIHRSVKSAENAAGEKPVKKSHSSHSFFQTFNGVEPDDDYDMPSFKISFPSHETINH